jgi:serine/threonine protein kinase
MEFCAGGNLKQLLSNSKVSDEYKNIYSKFTERQLINISAEIARGMKFLFENKVNLSNLYQ